MNFTSQELAQIAQQAELLKIMGLNKCTTVRLDYVPPRPQMVIPRLPQDGMEPIELMQQDPIVLEFKLEDAMFGNATYACVTCGGKVVVTPFPWHSYEHLSKQVIHIAPAAEPAK